MSFLRQIRMQSQVFVVYFTSILDRWPQLVWRVQRPKRKRDAIEHFIRIYESYHGIINGFLLVILLSGLGSIGFMVVEEWTFFDSFFMTIITLSTVGYNEVKPLTPAGRVVAIILIMIGTVVIFGMIGLIASRFTELNLSGFFQRKRMMKQIETLHDHYIVCGAGDVGEQIISRFCQARLHFVVVEQRDEHLAVLYEKYEGFRYFVQGDATDEDILMNAGIQQARSIITTLPTDAANLFVVVTARDLNPKLQIISRAVDHSAISKLKRAGADHVISPNIISAERMAAVILKPNIVSFLDVITTDQANISLLMEEVTLTGRSHLVGKKLAEARIPQETGLMVIAIISGADRTYTFNPGSTSRLNVGDILIVLGTEAQVERLKKYAAA